MKEGFDDGLKPPLTNSFALTRYNVVRVGEKDLAHDMSQIIDIEIAPDVAALDSLSKNIAHESSEHASAPLENIAVI